MIESSTNCTERDPSSQTLASSSEIPMSTSEESRSDQVQILLQALSLTSQLASMDNKSYKTKYPKIQKELDDIQKRWKLEDTPILQLVSSIHKLQSTLSHIESEADYHSQTILENVALKQKVQDIEEESFTLKRAVKKLVKKNQVLEEKLSHNQRESRKLFSSMKKFVRQTHVEQLDAKEFVQKTKLSLHEHMLKQGGIVSEPDVTGNRVRSNTAESGLSFISDLDTLSYLDINTQDSSLAAQSPSHEIDEVSLQSLSSTPSIGSIRSSATPTLRMAENGHNLPAQQYAICFQKGEEIGLKFVQVTSDYTTVHLKPKSCTHECLSPTLNLHDSNLDESPVNHGYATENLHEMATPVRRTPKQKKKSMFLDFFSDVGDFTTPKKSKLKIEKRNENHNESDSSSSELCKYLFLVKDSFVDEDDDPHHRRSLIGSRLIAVNDFNLEIGPWDINLITDLLKSLEEDSATNAITLTFRRDILSPNQLKQFSNIEAPSSFPPEKKVSHGAVEMDSVKVPSVGEDDTDKQKQSSFSKLFKKR